jgi:peptidoglycan hydrolase-like protein with peptidoglycan-binding domain
VTRRFILAAVAAAFIVAPAGLATAEAGAATGSGAAHAAAVNWPTVRPGARGERVRTIQYMLDQRGYSVSVDGVYGSTTTAAVKSFQRAARLPIDGHVGSMTWPKLVVTIKRGNRGFAVLAMERWLRVVYRYRAVSIDGFFGPKDQATVNNVQLNHGLRIDGICGTATWKAIING